MKMKFAKKTVIAVLTASLAFSSVTSQAGIPVTDIGAAQQRAQNFLQEMAEMGKQLTEMKAQLDQAKKQYQALTGSRNLGDILNNPAIRSALPADWQKVYDNIQRGGYKGLDGTAAAIADAAGLLNKCHNLTNEKSKNSCESQAVQTAQMKSDLNNAFKAAELRLQQIEGLMGKINSATDPKAIADLQARIQIEQAKIQNEQTRIQMYKMMQEENEKLLIQQRAEARSNAARNFNSRFSIQK